MNTNHPNKAELAAQRAAFRAAKSLRTAFHGNARKLLQPVAARW